MGRRRGQPRTFGAALLMVGFVIGVACSSDDGSATVVSTTTTTSTTTTPITTTTLAPDATDVRPSTIAANTAVFAAGSVWVGGTDEPGPDGEFAVLRIDPATNEVVSSIDVGGAPLLVDAVGDVLWFATSEGLARVDTATEEVATVALGGPGRALAASEETVWVEVERDDLDAEITAVDATTLEQRPVTVTDAPFALVTAMATDGETLWASVSARATGGQVIAFDAATGDPLEDYTDPRATEPNHAMVLELVDGELWVCGHDFTCGVSDTETGEILRDAVIADAEGEGEPVFNDLLAAEGALWAVIALGEDYGEDGDDLDDRSTAIIKLHPATGNVLGPLYEGSYPPPRLAIGEGVAFLFSSLGARTEDRELVTIVLG